MLEFTTGQPYDEEMLDAFTAELKDDMAHGRVEAIGPEDAYTALRVYGLTSGEETQVQPDLEAFLGDKPGGKRKHRWSRLTKRAAEHQALSYWLTQMAAGPAKTRMQARYDALDTKIRNALGIT
jgi:hypothetical protein